MPKSTGLLGSKNRISEEKRKKKKRQTLKEYQMEWALTLRNNLLPRLRRAMHESSLAHLSTQVDVLRNHLTSFYDSLDQTLDCDTNGSSSAPTILHTSHWRSAMESPFLWLGDLHPYLFTNLLRSFLDYQEDDNDNDDDDDSSFQHRLRTRFELLNESNELLSRPWHIVTAWKSPSSSLTARVEQIECGVRLMAPALMARARAAQSTFVSAVANNKSEIGEAMASHMDDMVGVVLDANRLRRSVLTEIVGAATVYQAALFLEALSQFLVGFRDPHLVSEFESCKTPLHRINLSLPL